MWQSWVKKRRESCSADGNDFMQFYFTTKKCTVGGVCWPAICKLQFEFPFCARNAKGMFTKFSISIWCILSISAMGVKYWHLVYSRQIVQSAKPFTKCVSQPNIWNMQTDSHDMQGQKIETQLLFRILWSSHFSCCFRLLRRLTKWWLLPVQNSFAVCFDQKPIPNTALQICMM